MTSIFFRVLPTRWRRKPAGNENTSLLPYVYFSDFCQTNYYVNIYRTDLHEICRIGRTLVVGERPEVIFFDSLRNVAVASNFVGKNNNSNLWPVPVCVCVSVCHAVCMRFAMAAPPAYDKKGNCYTGRWQINDLIRWTQANQLTDQLTIINRTRGDKRVDCRKTLPCVLYLFASSIYLTMWVHVLNY